MFIYFLIFLITISPMFHDKIKQTIFLYLAISSSLLITILVSGVYLFCLNLEHSVKNLIKLLFNHKSKERIKVEPQLYTP